MKEQPEIKVQEVPVSDLLPYANNAKIHTREQIDQICSSIEQFGFNDPVAVWHNADDQMEIIEGHGRVMAAKKLGLDVVPVIYLDHLSDEQRRAYTHIHNQLTMNTEFDWDLLTMDMNDLDFDFSDFGFEVPDELPDYEEKESSAKVSEEFSVIVECDDEDELERTFNELQCQGYRCRISTL